jgi:protein-S-isoprenylcysteine O-methyltransferase Ste14
MNLTNSYLVAFPWIAWAIYWYVASRGTKAVAYRESAASRALHIVPLAIAFMLLAVPSLPWPWLNTRFVPWATWPFWLGAALTVAGLLFTVWARVHLAANWSGTVTIKRSHELITSGPYRIVRNPMYTGLLFAIVGTAVWRGDLQGVLAVVVTSVSLWRKLRVEEQVLQRQFGQSYEAYRHRVRALIPYVV